MKNVTKLRNCYFRLKVPHPRHVDVKRVLGEGATEQHISQVAPPSVALNSRDLLFGNLNLNEVKGRKQLSTREQLGLISLERRADLGKIATTCGIKRSRMVTNGNQ